MTELIEKFVAYKHAMSDPQEWLNTPSGTALWLDGLNAIESIDPRALVAQSERDQLSSLGLRILEADYFAPTNSVAIMNDFVVSLLSPTYRSIRNKFEQAEISIDVLKAGSELAFAPWSKRIQLSTPYVSSYRGIDRIQFFTFHHEACHAAVFGEFYRKGPGENEKQILESLILIEWFCIALDFVVASEIGAFNAGLHAIDELSAIENVKPTNSDDRVLKRSARDRAFAEIGSNELKRSFQAGLHNPVKNADFTITEKLIGLKTIDFHVAYSRDVLLPELPETNDINLGPRRQQLIQMLRTQNAFETAEKICAS